MSLFTVPQSGESFPTDEELTPDIEDFEDILAAAEEFAADGY